MTPNIAQRSEWISIAFQDILDMSWQPIPGAPYTIAAARAAERDGALYMTTKKHADGYELRVKHRVQRS